MPESPAIFDDVEVVSAKNMTMRVRVQGKVVVVGKAQVLRGTNITAKGDRGRLVLTRWVAQDLGLTIEGS